MIALAVVSAFILVLLFLLLTPLVIEVDSTTNLYEVRINGLANARILAKEGSLFIRLKVLWWKKMINPFEPAIKEQRKAVAVKDNHKKSPLPRGVNRKIRAVLRSFRVKALHVDIDTGEMLLNAWLYPVAWAMQRKGSDMQINFNGTTTIKLKVVNNMARIIWAII